MREGGARIISITEPMIGEDTPESFYMEGMFALNNQYESMKTGRNVKQGSTRRPRPAAPPAVRDSATSTTLTACPTVGTSPASASIRSVTTL